MPPAGRAVKPPFPQFRPPKKDGDRRRAGLIDFDAMGGSGSSQNNLPFSSNLALICLKPLCIISAQNDRDACGWMIMKSPAVIRLEELVEINIEYRMIPAKFPPIKIWGAGEILDYPRGRMFSHMIQNTAP